MFYFLKNLIQMFSNHDIRAGCIILKLKKIFYSIIKEVLCIYNCIF